MQPPHNPHNSLRLMQESKKKLHLEFESEEEEEEEEDEDEEEEDVLELDSEKVGESTGCTSIPSCHIGYYLPQYCPKTMNIGFDASKMDHIELIPLGTNVALGCTFENTEFNGVVGLQLHRMVTSAVFETVCAVDDVFKGMVEPICALNIRLREWMNENELEPVKEFSDVLLWSANRKYRGRPDLVFRHMPSGSLVVAEIKSTTSDVSYANHVVTGDTVVGNNTILQMADYVNLLEANSGTIPVSSTAVLLSYRISESDCRLEILPVDLRSPRQMGGNLLVPFGVVNGLRASHGLLKPCFDRDLENRMTRERGYLAQQLGLYTCFGCGLSFGKRSVLTGHVQHVHESQRDFECVECTKNFKTKGYLNRHVAMVHRCERSFGCVKCPAKFGQKSALYRHIAVVHRKERNFECGECSKRFGGKGDLVSHIRQVHRKERKFECFQCPARFGLKQNLNSHAVSVHLKLKQFRCEKCSYASGDRRNLKVHMRRKH